MEQTRTYLYVRLWRGFSQGIPSAKFDDVPDEELGEALEYLASLLWLEKASPSELPSLDEWSQRVRSRPAPALPPLDEQERLKAGVATLCALESADFDLRAPQWQVIHAEERGADLDAIISALPHRVGLGCPAGFRKVPQASMPYHEWLALERELEELAQRPLPNPLARKSRLMERILQNGEDAVRLRHEAIALSRHLRAVPSQVLPPTAAGSPPESKSAPRSSEVLNAARPIPPRLQRVAADLARVEALAPDSAWPLESAWEWLREHGAADGEDLPERETWLRYAREVNRLRTPRG